MLLAENHGVGICEAIIFYFNQWEISKESITVNSGVNYSDQSQNITSLPLCLSGPSQWDHSDLFRKVKHSAGDILIFFLICSTK